jgi:hypothetical protein
MVNQSLELFFFSHLVVYQMSPACSPYKGDATKRAYLNWRREGSGIFRTPESQIILTWFVCADLKLKG